MTPEQFTKFEDAKAIKALKIKIAKLIDGEECVIVVSAVQEVFFELIHYNATDEAKYLEKVSKFCLERSKTIKPNNEEEL